MTVSRKTRRARPLRALARRGLLKFSRYFIATLDTGSLQRQVLIFNLAVLVLGAVGMLGAPAALTGSRTLLPVDGVSLLAALALTAATLGATVLHQRRLTALIVIGAVGLLVALAFVKFSAPDLALTQLAVEVVTIVLLLLALYFLPKTTPAESS